MDTSKLPAPDTKIVDLTDSELAALLEFREEEMRREWCITLILPEVQALRHEQERRAILKSS